MPAFVQQDVQPAELTGPPPRRQPPIQPPTPHRDGRRPRGPPFTSISPAIWAPAWSWISVTRTAAPSLANRLAVAAPMPLAGPVTRASRPASLSTAPFPQFRASSYSHQQLSVPLPDAPDEEEDWPGKPGQTGDPAAPLRAHPGGEKWPACALADDLASARIRILPRPVSPPPGPSGTAWSPASHPAAARYRQ